MTLSKRVAALEEAFKVMTNNLTWHTRIGYYIASIVTALTIKIMFFGV